jgi:hypothetical protein
MAGDTSGILQLATNGSTTAITIDTSQNVGIGTTSSVQKLTVWGAGTLPSEIPNTQLLVGRTDGFANAGIALVTNATNASSLTFGSTASPTLGRIEYDNTNNYMRFYTNSSERMRIDSSGNVLVGTTSVPSSSNSGVRLGIPGNNFWISFANTTANYAQFIFGNPNGQVGSIATNGSATSYVTSSDYRLKENIVPMTGALDIVQALKPVTYNWKIDGSNGQGFIAHELQAIVPDAVVGEKDAVETYTDEDGIEQTRPVYQGIDTSFLVATLTAAIQEQQAIINDLKARITALEGAA